MPSSVDEHVSEEAQRIMEEALGKLPGGAPYPAVTHVETKYAIIMKSQRVTNATVVINNDRGVCGRPYGCRAAVELILPVGSSMTVHYPGATKPVVIKGKATPEE